MAFEDDNNPAGTVTRVTHNVLGARGIDRISITENSATTHGYPIYDGHGNCRAILTKNGTGYGTGNWRTYDVWGSVRSGSATGDPKSRYVASIGHVADDESSLIYMRARYYEPATGRFISEDPAMDGANWYVYCGSDPVNRLDVTGKEHVPEFTKLLIQNLINIAIAGALYTFGRELYDQYAAGGEFNILRLTLKLVKGGVMAALGVAYFAALEVGLTAAAANGFALAEVAAYATYALFITAFIVLMDVALDSLVDSLAPWNR